MSPAPPLDPISALISDLNDSLAPSGWRLVTLTYRLPLNEPYSPASWFVNLDAPATFSYSGVCGNGPTLEAAIADALSTKRVIELRKPAQALPQTSSTAGQSLLASLGIGTSPALPKINRRI